MGSSAAFSCELSENLPKPSRHHLELMKEESNLFLSLFKNGIFYQHGGVGTGFKHVEPTTYTTRLLVVKGKRYPRVFEIPVNASELNEGDVFVLDTGLKIYYWAGKDCNIHEKFKALEIANNIKENERHSKAALLYPRDVQGAVEDEFWALLGGKPD